MNADQVLQLVTDRSQVQPDGHTRGWIVPGGTPAGADLELECVDFINILANSDPGRWRQNLIVALGRHGYDLVVGGYADSDPVVVADIKRGDGTVKAEAAPLGVQLWPTIAPKYARNFTLEAVTRYLGVDGREHVTWTYQNGNSRHFLAGQDVAVRIQPEPSSTGRQS